MGGSRLVFANCNSEGEDTIHTDGMRIKMSRVYGKETKVAFNVHEGTNLTIKANDCRVIRLMDVKIECGKF